MISLHETCEQYVARRLSEGWRIISQTGFNVILQSPEGIKRPVDLRNDVETLRPNAAGSTTDLTQYPTTGEHWDKVDEAASDSDTTYVVSSAYTGIKRDSYNLSAHTGSGVINFVKAYANARYANTAGFVRLGVWAGVIGPYEGANQTLTSSYALYSGQWNTNPATEVAWTWDDIDALQISIGLSQTVNTYRSRCTQAYVEVDYTAVTEKTSSDSGTGTDVYVSLEKPEAKTSSDTGSGAEGTPTHSAILSGSEIGSAIEALVARLLAAFDAGTGIEVGSLLKELFASELGWGNDSIIAKIEMPTKGGGMKLWT